MKRHPGLWFGPLAAVLLGLGIVGLALAVPGYDHVRQTVSEIGEIESPARVPFAILLSAVAVCLLVFAVALRRASIEADHSPLAAWFTAFFALSVIGVGVFAYPHPLHNAFGLSELIGYQAPLVLALTWRRDPRARTMVRVSWAAFVLVWLAIGLNLSSMDSDGAVWTHVKPYIGIAQRGLFAAWFGWCALVGVLLSRRDAT